MDNQIEVLPASQLDDRIRFAVYRAIYSKPPLQKYQMGAVPPIHIIVKNHDVTLEGMVNSVSDRDLAGLAAKAVPNVFRLTNHLSPLFNGSGFLPGLEGTVSTGTLPQPGLRLWSGLSLSLVAGENYVAI